MRARAFTERGLNTLANRWIN